MRTAQNYNESGGDKTVIGGTLEITGTVTYDGAEVAPAANQAASTAEDVATLLTDFNSLLAKLKAAGIMVADE